MTRSLGLFTYTPLLERETDNQAPLIRRYPALDDGPEPEYEKMLQFLQQAQKSWPRSVRLLHAPESRLFQHHKPYLAVSLLQKAPIEVLFSIFDHVRIGYCPATKSLDPSLPTTSNDMLWPMSLIPNAVRYNEPHKIPTKPYSRLSPFGLLDVRLEKMYTEWYLKTTQFVFSTRYDPCCPVLPSDLNFEHLEQVLEGVRVPPTLEKFLSSLQPSTSTRPIFIHGVRSHPGFHLIQQPSMLKDVKQISLELHASTLLFLFAPDEVVELLQLPIAQSPRWIRVRSLFRSLKLDQLHITILNDRCCTNGNSVWTAVEGRELFMFRPCRYPEDETAEPDYSWVVKSIVETVRHHGILSQRGPKTIAGSISIQQGTWTAPVTHEVWNWNERLNRRTSTFRSNFERHHGDWLNTSWSRLHSQADAMVRHRVRAIVRRDEDGVFLVGRLCWELPVKPRYVPPADVLSAEDANPVEGRPSFFELSNTFMHGLTNDDF